MTKLFPVQQQESMTPGNGMSSPFVSKIRRKGEKEILHKKA